MLTGSSTSNGSRYGDGAGGSRLEAGFVLARPAKRRNSSAPRESRSSRRSQSRSTAHAAESQSATSSSRHSSPRYWRLLNTASCSWRRVKRLPGRPSEPSRRCWTIRSPSRVRGVRVVRSSPMTREKPSSGCSGWRASRSRCSSSRSRGVAARAGWTGRRCRARPRRGRRRTRRPSGHRRAPARAATRRSPRRAAPSSRRSSRWRRSGSSRCRRSRRCPSSRRRSCSPTGCRGSASRSRRAA